MEKDNLSILRTRPEDEGFHRSRIMFVIKDGKVEVGPRNVKDSHMEWFEKKGWLTKENVEDFMKNHIRGFYLENLNTLYCYRGTGFGFDNKVKSELLDNLQEIKKALNLNDETKIHLGPKDSPLYGINWPTIYLGNMKELVDKE